MFIGGRPVFKLPSWAVAVFGASLVIVSIAIEPLRLRGLELEIADAQDQVRVLNESTQRLWGSYVLADQREAIAHNFIATGTDIFNFSSVIIRQQGNAPPRTTMLLARAGQHLQSAIHEMWRATGDGDSNADLRNATDEVCEVNAAGDDWQATVSGLLDEYEGGRLAAYGDMGEILDAHRRRSDCVRSYRRNQIAQDDARRVELQRQRERVRGQQIRLNILGLMILLLKDLPIWLSPKR